MWTRFPRRAGLLLALFLAAFAVPAHAYEFEVRARTLGQGYQLNALRFSRSDLTLARVRLSQTISLSIWDIMGRREGLGRLVPDEKGPRLSFQSYLRFEHDFGKFVAGNQNIAAAGMEPVVFDVVDLIPELSEHHAQFDMLYGFFAIEDLFDETLDLYVGRQMSVATLDWWSMDGVTARYHLPVPVTLEAFGGLRVRQESFLGSPTQAPDGTSESGCQEYIAGSTPGTGSWRPIDLPVGGDPQNRIFDSCPQAEELAPTFGGAVETRWSALRARLAYRRTVSPTVKGLYPDELGQAPGFGVHEERLSATVRSPLSFKKGRVRVVPYAAARYSLLHGLLDEAHAGVQTRFGDHQVEPEAFYSYPTFDGDSIFNVFSTEPYLDYRLTYRYAPVESPWNGYARGWLRRYGADPGVVDEFEFSGGGQLGVGFQRSANRRAQADVFYDDGYGGQRVGGLLSYRWQHWESLLVSSRLSVIRFEEDLRAALSATTFGAQLGGTYFLNDNVALSLLVEENINKIVDSDTRVWAMVDLAYGGQR